MSTFALTVFRHKQKDESGKEIDIDFWVSRKNELPSGVGETQMNDGATTSVTLVHA